MESMKNLVQQFAKAGLKLVQAKQPFGGSENVFGMDIPMKVGGNRRGEWFRIWPGHDSNLIQVCDTDKSICQLVLLVREEEREFERDITPFGKERKKMETASGRKEVVATFLGRNPHVKPKDVFCRGKEMYLRDKTPAETRKYLMGLDERQLFIADVGKRVMTVAQAHESLKSTTVTLAEGRMKGKTVRQGEWFFLHPTKEELTLINEEVKKHLVFKKQGIGVHAGRRQGNPHTADELVVVAPKVLEHGFSVRPRKEVYVRGKVRHRDHKTVEFKTWRKVLGNTEAAPANLGRGGIYWID